MIKDNSKKEAVKCNNWDSIHKQQLFQGGKCVGIKMPRARQENMSLSIQKWSKPAKETRDLDEPEPPIFESWQEVVDHQALMLLEKHARQIDAYYMSMEVLCDDTALYATALAQKVVKSAQGHKSLYGDLKQNNKKRAFQDGQKDR